MTEAHVVWDPATDEAALYVVEDAPGGRTILEFTSDGVSRRTVIRNGDVNKPTLRLPRQMLEAITAELVKQGYGPKPVADPNVSAAERHLSDAVAVRDRLLVIIERSKP